MAYAGVSNAISDDEQKTLHAVHALTAAIQKQLEKPSEVTAQESKVFGSLGLKPLLSEIEKALSRGAFSEIKAHNRARLRGRAINLQNALDRLDCA